MKKFIKNNKGKIIVFIVIVMLVLTASKFRTENFKTFVNKRIFRGTYTGGSASRDPDARILAIERAHKCNAAGCATRETKQKKHILL